MKVEEEGKVEERKRTGGEGGRRKGSGKRKKNDKWREVKE